MVNFGNAAQASVQEWLKFSFVSFSQVDPDWEPLNGAVSITYVVMTTLTRRRHRIGAENWTELIKKTHSERVHEVRRLVR